MKRLLLFGLLLLAKWAAAQDIPQQLNPPRLVSDFAHVLTDEQAQALEGKLKAYNDSTSSEIAIVTVETTGNYEVEEYALKILRTWGVGTKKNNNGIVILAAIKDHKIRIEVGDGLEGAIPDITASSIIEKDMAPNFRADDPDNYYRGFDKAIDDIIKAAAGEYKADERPTGHGGRGGGGSILGIVIIFIIIIVILSRIGGGGGGGGTLSRGGFLPGLIIGSLLNGGGGGWGGGSSGGGGGGGFGGFGGGGGSGGGASGSW